MDSQTGNLYPSLIDAIEAGVPKEDIVEISAPYAPIGHTGCPVGPPGDDYSTYPPAVIRVSQAVKADRRRKNKAARKARRNNR